MLLLELLHTTSSCKREDYVSVTNTGPKGNCFRSLLFAEVSAFCGSQSISPTIIALDLMGTGTITHFRAAFISSNQWSTTLIWVPVPLSSASRVTTSRPSRATS
jgi:hypothetical protein